MIEENRFLKGFLELTSGLEPPNLLITNEVLYRLSYSSAHELCYYILHPLSIILQEVEHFFCSIF